LAGLAVFTLRAMIIDARFEFDDAFEPF